MRMGKGASQLRKARHSQPGLYYFLTTVTASRLELFQQDNFASIALEALRSPAHLRHFRTDAAVVMPDHVHFCGELLQGDLPRLMSSYKGYTGYALCAAGASRPVWHRGYHDHALRSDEDYRQKMLYLRSRRILSLRAAAALWLL